MKGAKLDNMQHESIKERFILNIIEVDTDEEFLINSINY